MKGVFIASSTPSSGHPQHLHTLHHHSKCRLPLLCLPKGMPSCQTTYEELEMLIQLHRFQEHKIVCNLPDLSCSVLLFLQCSTYCSISSHSPGNHKMTEYQHHWSNCLWMFSPFSWLWQTADSRRHHWPLKETWQKAGWLSSSRLQDPTWQFCNFTTDSPF